jgi:hypothetical protein
VLVATGTSFFKKKQYEKLTTQSNTKYRSGTNIKQMLSMYRFKHQLVQITDLSIFPNTSKESVPVPVSLNAK